jgi:hypothetical protein
MASLYRVLEPETRRKKEKDGLGYNSSSCPFSSDRISRMQSRINSIEHIAIPINGILKRTMYFAFFLDTIFVQRTDTFAAFWMVDGFD